MALPLYLAVAAGAALVGYIAKDKTSEEVTNNYNYNLPEQPNAEAFYFNSGDNVTDSSGLYLVSAVTLFAFYKWGN
jgi:hypothetical protein